MELHVEEKIMQWRRHAHKLQSRLAAAKVGSKTHEKAQSALEEHLKTQVSRLVLNTRTKVAVASFEGMSLSFLKKNCLALNVDMGDPLKMGLLGSELTELRLVHRTMKESGVSRFAQDPTAQQGGDAGHLARLLSVYEQDVQQATKGVCEEPEPVGDVDDLPPQDDDDEEEHQGGPGTDEENPSEHSELGGEEVENDDDEVEGIPEDPAALRSVRAMQYLVQFAQVALILAGYAIFPWFLPDWS